MDPAEAASLDDKWFDFTLTCVEKLNAAGGRNWSVLTPEEQELAALWKLEMDIYNGGFVQFFCNWGVECYGYATGAFKNRAQPNAWVL